MIWFSSQKRTSFASTLTVLAALSAVACSSSPQRPEASQPITQSPPSQAAAPTEASSATPKKGETPLKTQNNVVAGVDRECKRDKETRKLSIEKLDPKGCRLEYEKFGTKSVVASSASGTSHCESVEKRIRDNLTAAGFKCTE